MSQNAANKVLALGDTGLNRLAFRELDELCDRDSR